MGTILFSESNNRVQQEKRTLKPTVRCAVCFVVIFVVVSSQVSLKHLEEEPNSRAVKRQKTRGEDTINCKAKPN